MFEGIHSIGGNIYRDSVLGSMVFAQHVHYFVLNMKWALYNDILLTVFSLRSTARLQKTMRFWIYILAFVVC